VSPRLEEDAVALDGADTAVDVLSFERLVFRVGEELDHRISHHSLALAAVAHRRIALAQGDTGTAIPAFERAADLCRERR
jgi:hypothetical protein